MPRFEPSVTTANIHDRVARSRRGSVGDGGPESDSGPTPEQRRSLFQRRPSFTGSFSAVERFERKPSVHDLSAFSADCDTSAGLGPQDGHAAAMDAAAAAAAAAANCGAANGTAAAAAGPGGDAQEELAPPQAVSELWKNTAYKNDAAYRRIAPKHIAFCRKYERALGYFLGRVWPEDRSENGGTGVPDQNAAYDPAACDWNIAKELFTELADNAQASSPWLWREEGWMHDGWESIGPSRVMLDYMKGLNYKKPAAWNGIHSDFEI
jgi:hypothetical protein